MSTELFICAYKPILSKNLINEVRFLDWKVWAIIGNQTGDIITCG